MTNKILCLLLALMALTFTGCNDRFIEVDALTLKTKWEDSDNHSAVSWWYAGEKGDYLYLVEKWPLKSNGYKIKKTELVITLEHPLNLTSVEEDWVNLKKHHLSFRE